MGYSDGYNQAAKFDNERSGMIGGRSVTYRDITKSTKPKRKLSAWNKFVKANSKKKIYRYANGKLKLKKMGIAFRKKKRR